MTGNEDQATEQEKIWSEELAACLNDEVGHLEDQIRPRSHPQYVEKWLVALTKAMQKNGL